MKNNKRLYMISLLLATGILVVGCSSKDNSTATQASDTTAATQTDATPISTDSSVASDSEADSLATASETTALSSTLTFTTKDLVEESENYDIAFNYPIFSNTVFDDAIKGNIDKQAQDFIAETKATEGIDGLKFALIGQFEVYNGGTQYTTVKLDSSWNLGGAHPNPMIYTICYDQTSDKIITLDDIFKPNSDYLTALSADCKDALLLNNPDLQDTLEESGLTPDAENFQYFALTDEGIHFFFPPYQVASYAAGEQSVLIPYTQVSEWLALTPPTV